MIEVRFKIDEQEDGVHVEATVLVVAECTCGKPDCKAKHDKPTLAEKGMADHIQRVVGETMEIARPLISALHEAQKIVDEINERRADIFGKEGMTDEEAKEAAESIAADIENMVRKAGLDGHVFAVEAGDVEAIKQHLKDRGLDSDDVPFVRPNNKVRPS